MRTPDGQLARVLLVSTNPEDQPYPVYPLALDYLRAPLTAAGCLTRTWDQFQASRTGVSSVHSPPSATSASSPVLADLTAALREFQPHVVLASIRNADNNDAANTRDYVPAALAIIATIKAHSHAKIVLGGSGYSLFPAAILRASVADCGIAGAGEHVVVPLVAQLLADRLPRELPGLVWRVGNQCQANPPTPPAGDTAPAPHDPALLGQYWQQGGLPGIQLKRGCPFQCVYCTYPLLEGRTFEPRDVVAVVDEMQRAYETAGIDQFFMVDSVLNGMPALVRAFAAELCRRQLPIRWSGYFLPQSLTADDLQLWRASGLDGLEFGVDTLCPALLRQWGKAFQRADVEQAVALTAAAGLPYSVFLILGGPGETEATLDETIAAAQAFPRAVLFAFLGMRIYPRTRLYDQACRDGLIAATDDLLTPRFYISPALDRARLAARLDQLGRQPNWLVVGPSLLGKTRAAARLRQHGRKGALWQELTPP